MLLSDIYKKEVCFFPLALKELMWPNHLKCSTELLGLPPSASRQWALLTCSVLAHFLAALSEALTTPHRAPGSSTPCYVTLRFLNQPYFLCFSLSWRRRNSFSVLVACLESLKPQNLDSLWRFFKVAWVLWGLWSRQWWRGTWSVLRCEGWSLPFGLCSESWDCEQSCQLMKSLGGTQLTPPTHITTTKKS